MANPEHLKILEEGPDVWKKWRDKNPWIIPDLRNVNFNGANLNGANLNEVNLSDAKLNKASLKAANLFRANLEGAELYETNFQEADLTKASLVTANLQIANLEKAKLLGTDFGKADLSSANLEGANLAEARLSRTNLSNTKLSGSNFFDTILYETLFIDVNLSNVQNLALCQHHGPSTLDHRTLAQSGILPLNFLRGCGLPDEIIDMIPILRSDPIQFYSCFISYSSKDEEFAKRLYADLQNKGIRCWFAPEDLKIGDKTRNAIDDAIRIHDKLLLILTENSVESEWVAHETENALEQEIKRRTTVLFPIRLDDEVMSSEAGWASKIKRERHIGDFRKWKEHDSYVEAFNRLIRDLKAISEYKSS